MLKIHNLQSGYDKMEILHGIDFNVKPKEIVAIIGPNGAGKSTLLKSIFNLCEIYSGRINFNQKELAGLPTHQLISLGISYVPQGRQIFSNMTVKENLDMGVFAIKNRALIANKLKEIFQQFPFLKQRKNDLASNLSGGEQQILAISRALIQEPKLLLLDEPSLGLAPKIVKEIFQKIREINEQGIRIIIVEQNAKKAVEVAHRTYILENGRVVLQGGKEILQDKRIKNIYFGGI